jgi:hypothetical protein
MILGTKNYVFVKQNIFINPATWKAMNMKCRRNPDVFYFQKGDFFYKFKLIYKILSLENQ